MCNETVLVFAGIDKSCKDTANLENETRYYYAGLTCDRAGNYNSTVIITSGTPRRNPMDVLFEVQTARTLGEAGDIDDYKGILLELINQYQAAALASDRILVMHRNMI